MGHGSETTRLVARFSDRAHVRRTPLGPDSNNRGYQCLSTCRCRLDVPIHPLMHEVLGFGFHSGSLSSELQNSYVSTLCPVVICPYLCTSDPYHGHAEGHASVCEVEASGEGQAHSPRCSKTQTAVSGATRRAAMIWPARAAMPTPRP